MQIRSTGVIRTSRVQSADEFTNASSSRGESETPGAALALVPEPEQAPSSIASAHNGTVVLQCGPEIREIWFGRLGNNILCVFNAALEAHNRGMQFAIKNCSHTIFNLSSYDYYAQERLQYVPIKEVLTPGKAFYLNMFKIIKVDYPGLELILPLQACCLRRTMLEPLFEGYANLPATLNYSEDALVIHIRSGDIFNRNITIHPMYSPPPLAYYQEIIEEHSMQSREVILVTLNKHMSPLVAALLEIYPHIKIQAGSLEEDVAVLLAARHLVVSQGTFAWALALASSKLETLYTFNNKMHIMDDRVFCDVIVVQISTEEYFSRWEATDEQIAHVMAIPRSDLRRKTLDKSSQCLI